MSLFVQDGWSLPGRLTLSAGLRVDVNRGSVPQISNVFSTTPVSPRIGLAWDVRGDHRTVARAHSGRYHDTIFSSRIAQADVSGLTPYTWAQPRQPATGVREPGRRVQPVCGRPVNQAVPDSDSGQPYVEFSGTTFGQPQTWVSPRLLRAAIRYTF